MSVTRAQHDQVPQPVSHHDETTIKEEEHDLNDESRDPLEDSGCTRSEDDEEEEVEDTVIEDMRSLEESFRGFGRKYRLINRIGEGKQYTSQC